MLSRRASLRFIVGAGVGTGIVALGGTGTLSLFTSDPQLAFVSRLIALAGLVTLVSFGLSIIRNGRANSAAWFTVLFWVVGAAVVTILADPEPWIDVWALHADAASALGETQSPYQGRSLANAMPWFPDGSTFEGYVYPPVVLFTYALTDMALGDSRWLAVGIGALIVLMVKRLSTSATSDGIAALMLLSPGWPLMVQLSWTEPASVLLLATAFVFGPAGRLHPVLFGVLIGSKQYMLAWAVPSIASWIRRRPRALALSGVVAVATYAVGLLFGPTAFIESAFVFHVTAPTAFSGSHLPGLARMIFDYPLEIPAPITYGLAVASGWLLASRRPRSDASMVLGGLAMLSIMFLLGSQAFPNYWYFVISGASIAILALGHTADPSENGPADPSLLTTTPKEGDLRT